MIGDESLLRRYLGTESVLVAGMAALLAAQTGLAVAGPLLLGRFVDGVAAGQALSRLVHLAEAYLLVTALAGLARVSAGYLTVAVAWRVTNALREDVVAHLLPLPLGFFSNRAPGEMVERVDGDVNTLSGFLSDLCFKLGGSALLVFGTLVALYLVSPAVMLVLAVLTGGLGLLLDRLRRGALPLYREERGQNAQAYGTFGDYYVLHAGF